MKLTLSLHLQAGERDSVHLPVVRLKLGDIFESDVVDLGGLCGDISCVGGGARRQNVVHLRHVDGGKVTDGDAWQPSAPVRVRHGLRPSGRGRRSVIS